MRLIKLSIDKFTDEAALQKYFTQTLQGRTPPGLFRIPSGWVAKDGLYEGETLLFSHRNRLRFIAKTTTGRLENSYMPDPKYPFCFIIDLTTLRTADSPLEEVELQLREAGLQNSFQGRGWNKIPDSQLAEDIIDALAEN